MGFLQLISKSHEKKSLGVCVPEAYLRKHTGQKIHEQSFSGSNLFKVSGVFAVKDSVVLEGKMAEGRVKAGKTIEVGGRKVKVSSLSVERKSAEEMLEGEKGAIFIETKRLPMIKAGDVIEF